MNKEDAQIEMKYELEALHVRLPDAWLADSLPLEKSGLEYLNPCPKAKTSVTVRLNTDMVRWFRKVEQGYVPGLLNAMY